jgi:lipoprotein NlpD
MTANLARNWRLILLAAALAGCASKPPAPVVERTPPKVPAPEVVTPSPATPAGEAGQRPETYTVKPGDTLYKIALDLGLDYRELAAWNNIDNVNLLRAGQVLRIRPPGEGAVVTAPLKSVPPVTDARSSTLPSALAPARANTPGYKSSPKAVKLPYSDDAYAQLMKAAPPTATAGGGGVVVASAPATSSGVQLAPTAPPPPATAPPAPAPSEPASDGQGEDKVDWSWPTEGKVITAFNDNANLKGVDIAGKAGQPVIATAAGKVVYAGSGLRGYGKLVIIKHNKTFLSAYAHNSTILVKEGQQVSKGQKIAEMGNSDSDSVKLHFEIRRLGKPVDPLKFLPPA